MTAVLVVTDWAGPQLSLFCGVCVLGFPWQAAPKERVVIRNAYYGEERYGAFLEVARF